MSNASCSPEWPIEEACGALVLSGRQATLRLRARLVDEDFRSHTPAREFVPLSVQQGQRTVVAAHFYTAEPDLMSSELRPPRIGAGEAYYYQADAILLLWRCNLLDRYRTVDPAVDGNLAVLWDAFEMLLGRQFPHAVQLVTPAWNRPYDEPRWQAFLRGRGCTRPSPVGIPGAAWIKDLAATR